MDTGIILGYSAGYVATLAAVFLLYLPHIILAMCLLIAAGLLQLLLLPFALLVRRLRRNTPARETDNERILDLSSKR